MGEPGMTRESFPSWLPPWMLTAAIAALLPLVVGLGAFAERSSPVGLLTAVGSTAVAWISFAAWRRRKRPVIEVSDEEIAFGSIVQGGRKRVALSEVANVYATGPERLDLVTRDGERIQLPLREVRRKHRDAVRPAIERRLADGPDPR